MGGLPEQRITVTASVVQAGLTVISLVVSVVFRLNERPINAEKRGRPFFVRAKARPLTRGRGAPPLTPPGSNPVWLLVCSTIYTYMCINAPEGCRHARHTHKWDGLHTRHLLESTHTNTHKHKQTHNVARQSMVHEGTEGRRRPVGSGAEADGLTGKREVKRGAYDVCEGASLTRAAEDSPHVVS